MFDDLKNQNISSDSNKKEETRKDENESGLNAPSASKQQVEDIFAETDKVRESSPKEASRTESKPEAFQPKRTSELVPLTAQAAPSASGWVGRVNKYVMLGVVVLAVIVILSGGWYVYGKFFSATNGLVPTVKVNQESVVNKKSTDETKTEIKNEVNIQKRTITPITKPADKDHDGLSDEEEKELGTNPNNVDSDGDGLFDREEVKVYKTDPLNKDTDGDGFLDGDEVKNGYNPNGKGRLYKIK